VNFNYTKFLGYTKDSDCNIVIVPEEAEVVRKIFDMYLAGNGVRKIKKYLESNGIKTVTGKNEWSTSTIDRILSNEKYIGKAILQKSITVNYLNKERIKNEGQFPQYIVENSHEAIILIDIFDKVQFRKEGQLRE